LHDVGSSLVYDNSEPDLFVSEFDTLLIHDYANGKSFLTGNARRFDKIMELISNPNADRDEQPADASVNSNFTKSEYLKAIEIIKAQIRCGKTYQTNLTQQLSATVSKEKSTTSIFRRIRRDHPAPFTAFLERINSSVISASPERFFRVDGRQIFASPIKGTRPRGKDPIDDERLRNELLNSEKDRAENTMIVDLLRNDLGRVCEYGSVQVEEFCTLQKLPTLYHLVSTIKGQLRINIKPSEIIGALFPCGSITGAPKLRTMQIIDDLEKIQRGLSMGAIGVYLPSRGSELPPTLDLSVAIRTMVIRDGVAKFNVGGGIVIDSDPETEYKESLLKARALLNALGAEDLEKME
jgi:para-aminobenzoate synthetase component 1